MLNDLHQQMFKATQAREFDVLVIDDLSRFGRDQVETECVGRTSEAQGRPAEVTTTPGLPWVQADDRVRLYEMFNRPERVRIPKKHIAADTLGEYTPMDVPGSICACR
jgi:hypothetical protein